MQTTVNHTDPTVFDRMTQDERWQGFGYIGERARFVAPSDDAEYNAWMSHNERQTVVARTDERVLAEATARRWKPEQLFAWANSRHGRHFADLAFSYPERIDQAVRQCLRQPR